MSEEWRDKGELRDSFVRNKEETETIGETLLGHQQDLEKLQGELESLKHSRGLYEESDNKLDRDWQDAIKTRETDVENSKAKIGEIKTEMETKFENLTERIQKANERVIKMEQVVNSLNHKNEGVINNIRGDIRQQKDDIDDAKGKCNLVGEMINIATSLVNAIGNSAEGIAHLLEALHNLFK